MVRNSGCSQYVGSDGKFQRRSCLFYHKPVLSVLLRRGEKRRKMASPSIVFRSSTLEPYRNKTRSACLFLGPLVMLYYTPRN